MESGFLLFLMPLAVRHIRHTRTKRGSMATRAVIATIGPASAIPATPRVRHRVGVRVHAGGSALSFVVDGVRGDANARAHAARIEGRRAVAQRYAARLISMAHISPPIIAVGGDRARLEPAAGHDGRASAAVQPRRERRDARRARSAVAR
ncbi:hypothetical protein X963_5334 [Burkholderia pseudomallei MSHR7498]|nr:hypothetical protein X963_5334 [Burkholderia pseudomallei MSHR7498]